MSAETEPGVIQMRKSSPGLVYEIADIKSLAVRWNCEMSCNEKKREQYVSDECGAGSKYKGCKDVDYE
jgi:hypothetical protein